MGKNKQKFTFEDFEKGLMLAGYLTPKNEQELLERESLWDYDKANDPSKIYFQRTVLAAEVVSNLYSERTFGRVKFQKLIYLCENAGNMNLNEKYLKFAAGPFDNKFMHAVHQEFKKQKWFGTRRVSSNGFSRTEYYPLENAGKHRKYYENYFQEVDDDIQLVINTFRKSNTKRVELVATIYYCLDEMIKTKMEFSDLRFLDLFYSWAEEKKKFSPPEIKAELEWMKKNGFVPAD